MKSVRASYFTIRAHGYLLNVDKKMKLNLE